MPGVKIHAQAQVADRLAAWQELALGYDRSRWAAQLAPLLQLWQSLTPSLPNFALLASSMQKLASSGTPLDACLASEIHFAQGLVNSVAAGLERLAEVILGSGTLEPKLQVDTCSPAHDLLLAGLCRNRLLVCLVNAHICLS